MRIPLDYYRILSVPIKATPAQLEQAYGDRLQQQPRHEFSELTIKARQDLIQNSYEVLSDDEARAAYDGQFLINMQPLAPVSETVVTESSDGEAAESGQVESEGVVADANPTIEIPIGQLGGALLILHELGEYETVLRLGLEHCKGRKKSQPAETKQTPQEDIVLALALAYLELVRERWHRQEYETAAESGQRGLELLQQKDLFPEIQDELERDLYRLRPYRILELISQSSVKSPERIKGIKLLQDMLQQREGIEGQGADRSGLSFDQFLCFIQQLRTYLTSEEQQKLFDDTSQQNSAIANYLAVYALLGRGYSLKQPELILQAQRKLEHLSERQDVSWEQSVVALLLGHTEKALHKLQQSTDPSIREQIEQYLLGSSDLLPGLCFYAEQWLREDVVAQFSDLTKSQSTLKEYFAQRQIQEYLEELAPPELPQKLPVPKEKVATVQTGRSREEFFGGSLKNLWRNLFASDEQKYAETNPREISSRESPRLARIGSIGQTATLERSATSINAHKNYVPSGAPANSAANYHRPSPRQTKPALNLPLSSSLAGGAGVTDPRFSQTQVRPLRKKAVQRKKRKAKTLWQGWLFIFGVILGFGSLSFMVMKLWLSPGPKSAQLAIAVSQPTVEIPAPKPQPKPEPKATFLEESQKVVRTWLNVKASAFGQQHKVEQLSQILHGPLLTTWQERAKNYQQENSYREYEHQVKMHSAKVNPQNQNRATVEAEVKEVAKHYQGGELDQAQSYDDNLLVRYQLIRQGEQWLIDQTEVLKTL